MRHNDNHGDPLAPVRRDIESMFCARVPDAPAGREEQRVWVAGEQGVRRMSAAELRRWR